MADTAAALVIQLSAETRQFQREMRKAIGEFDKSGREIERRQAKVRKQVESGWKGMSRAIIPSLGGIGAALSVREIIQYGDAWRAAGNKLAASGTPLDQVQTRLSEIADLAIRSRTGLDTTAAAYQRLRIATEQLGTSEQDALRYTELLNKSFVAGGASATEAASAALQLSQALASGTLQGDELRSLRENAPLLAQAIAKAMDASIGDLKKLGSEGKITAEVILGALDQAASGIEDKFSKTQITLSQAFVNLETSFTRFVGAASGGAIDILADAVGALAVSLEDIARLTGVAAAALAPAGLALAARAATGAVAALTAAIVTNPFLAAATVIAAAAAALYIYRDRLVPIEPLLKKSQDALDDLNDSLVKGTRYSKEIAASDYKRVRAANEAALADLRAAEAMAQRNLQAENAKGQVIDPNTGYIIGNIQTKGIEKAQLEVIRLQGQIIKTTEALKKLSSADVTPDVPKPKGADTGTGAASAFENVVSSPSDIQDELERQEHLSRIIRGAVEDRLRSLEDYQEAIRDGRRVEADALLQSARGWSDYAQIQTQVIQELAELDIQSANARLDADLRVLEERKLSDLQEVRLAGASAEQMLAIEKAYQGTRVNLESATAEQIKAIRAGLAAELAQVQTNQLVLLDSARDGLLDIGSAATRGFGAMRDAAASALDQISQMIMEMYVLKPLVEGLLGKSGTSGGGILGGLISGISGSFAGLFATGGVIPNGQWGIVGEKGPEIVSATGGGIRVTPNSGIQSWKPNMPSVPSGGASTTMKSEFNIHVTGTTDAEIIQQVHVAVRSALTEYDRKVLPSRVAMISKDPRSK